MAIIAGRSSRVAVRNIGLVIVTPLAAARHHIRWNADVRKHSLQSPPPRRGRVGWGRRRLSSTQSSQDRTTPTPTLPQLGGGGRTACFSYAIDQQLDGVSVVCGMRECATVDQPAPALLWADHAAVRLFNGTVGRLRQTRRRSVRACFSDV